MGTTDNAGIDVASTAGAGIDREASFPVRYGQRAGLATSHPVDTLRLVGDGTLAVRGGNVVLAGSTHKAFRLGSGQKDEHALPLSDICNVQTAEKKVRFEWNMAGGKRGFVVLEAADAADAARIGALLPGTQTEAFIASQAELVEFHRRLDRLSPKSRVVPALIAINLLVFVLMAVDGAGVFAPDGDVAVKWGSNFGPLTMDGQWWRLLTATFIHFGIFHVALNMWALYQSGTLTERLYGSTRFAVVYVFAGLTGSMASLLWNPGVNSAGASGAIFGVFGGMLAFVMNPRNAVPRALMTEHRNSTLLFAGYSLFYGAAHAGIDNAAHIGGLFGGLLMGFLLARPLDDGRLTSRNGLRLLGAAGAGVLTLALLMFPLVRPSDAVRNNQTFERALAAFPAKQDRAMQAMKNAQALVAIDTRATELAFAHAMQSDAYPQWNALYLEMAAPKLASDSPNAQRQALMLRYLDGRRRSCQLVAQAIEQDKKGMVDQAKAAAQDAEVAVKALNELNAAH